MRICHLYLLLDVVLLHQQMNKGSCNKLFDYVKECDITKLKKVASEDVLSGMDLEKMEKELSQYTEEEYGKVFVDETNKFKKAIFKDLFTDIKIKDIKADGDKTTVKVTGKQKDYSQVSFDQVN